MMRHLLAACVLLTATLFGASAQVIPEQQRPIVPATQQQDLPKFDVPDFVITGIEAIDLPDHDKEGTADEPVPLQIASGNGTSISRDRETAELTQRSRERIIAGDTPPAFIKAEATLGTHVTPDLRLWVGQESGTSGFLIHGRYAQTDGYGFNTNRSGGAFAISGTTMLGAAGSFMNGAVMGGSIGYGADSYGLHGSIVPWQRRERSTVLLSGTARQSSMNRFPFDIDLTIGSTAVNDSVRTAAETRVTMSAATVIRQFDIPWKLRGEIKTAGVSGNGIGGTSLMELSALSDPVLVNDVAISGGLQLFWGDGTGGQKLVRLYPALGAAVRLSPEHVVAARFSPHVEWGTFDATIDRNPYLAPDAVIRNRIVANTGEVSLNSDWNWGLRTRVGVEVQSVDDEPLFVDSTVTGLWRLAYGGKTTIATLSAKAFATLTANDYFSACLRFTSSKNADTGDQVPYLPGSDAALRLEHRFSSSVSSFAAVKFQYRRSSDLTGSGDMPAVLLADVGMEYQIDRALSLLVRAQNLFDHRYQIWRGYFEEPLTIICGVSARW